MMAGNMHPKTKAYSYVRISSKGQIDGRGISRQVQAAQDYADKHELDLDSKLSDIGKSGFHGHHVKFGALGNFLRLVKDGQIPIGSYLLVESLDRLSREDVLTAQSQFLDILSAGITIVTLIDGMVYHKDKDFTQLIISLTYMSRANNESKEKSDRIKDVIRNRKLEALQGKPRYNHHLVGWIDQKRVGETKDYEFSLNDKAKTVQRIFELFDEGLGVFSIAKILNTEKLPVLRTNTNTDQRWKDATIRLLLRNETAIGTYTITETVNGKTVPMGEPLKNYYPAAIPEDLFWRVQRRFKSKSRAGALGRRYANLFARNTSCAKCGRVLKMSRGGHEGNRIVYLTCAQRQLVKGHECDSPTPLFPYAPLEDSVLTYVTDFYEAAAAEMNAPHKNKAKLAKQLDDANEYLISIEKKRSNLMKLAEQDLDAADLADISKRMREWRDKIEEQKSYISGLETDIRQTDEKREELQSVLQQIESERKKWKTAGDDEVMQSRARVAKMLREFITTVEVDFDNQFATIWVGGFTSAYRFDRKGNLVSHVNILPMFQTGPVRTYVDRTPSGRARRIRVLTDAPDVPAMTDDMMRTMMMNMGWNESRIEMAMEASKRIRESVM